ncbi:hypothetical protein [Thalassospira alkalitolerans]
MRDLFFKNMSERAAR